MVGFIFLYILFNFNPRSREGSDWRSIRSFPRSGNFNPRSREGSDGIPDAHDPKHVDFNPRSREGSDWHVLAILRSHARFQSALPRGERRTHPRNTCHQNYFNPRSREGSDRGVTKRCQNVTHFNPRSREGSDQMRICLRATFCYFNPRSREGSDMTGHLFSSGSDRFQSALPRGERLSWVTAEVPGEDFNPRSREGSDF